jgi:pyridoxamine 5'-phosphate oxidase family protein
MGSVGHIKQMSTFDPAGGRRMPVVELLKGRRESMSFSEDEVAFMASQPLARVATVDDDGQPDVVPVGFEFDGTYINIGGFAPEKTRRHGNVLAGHNKIALVIDDLVSTQPWTPRYVRVYGTAEVVDDPQPHLRIRPAVSWSWNLSGEPLDHKSIAPPKKTMHQ